MPRLPGVARQSRAPVCSRYAAYSSARAAAVTPCQMRAISLEAVEFGDGAFIADVSRVQRRIGLEQQDFGFLVGDRLMLDAARDDDEFAGSDLNLAALQLHPHAALHHEKHLVLVVVMVPHELALE